jgi:hypothetical protein
VAIVVGEHCPWRPALPLQELAQRTLGRFSITPALNQNVENDAVLVDRSPSSDDRSRRSLKIGQRAASSRLKAMIGDGRRKLRPAISAAELGCVVHANKTDSRVVSAKS